MKTQFQNLKQSTLKTKRFDRIVYAGNRDIAVWVLKFILKKGVKPLALMIPDKKIASHTKELRKLCDYLDNDKVLRGSQFREKKGTDLLRKLKPDYIIGIHFPHIIPKEALEIPARGVLNLHPAYLPYNRGWHTPTWAIWEGTPYGATLHFMAEQLDSGDIIYQEKLKILPEDTADTLYLKAKELEFKIFKKAWPSLLSGTYIRKPQNSKVATLHKKKDIAPIQSINLNKKIKAGDLIRQLMALTTNKIEEAAYFKTDGEKYRIQVKIIKDKN